MTVLLCISFFTNRGEKCTSAPFILFPILYILQSYFPYTLYYNSHCQQHNCKDYIPYRKISKILPFCTSCFILFTFLYIKFIRDQTCQGSDEGSQTCNRHYPESKIAAGTLLMTWLAAKPRISSCPSSTFIRSSFTIGILPIFPINTKNATKVRSRL